MQVSKIATAIALLGMAVPVTAQAGETAKAAGRVASATDGVYIARDGKLVPASKGQILYKGDRVVTRAQASAQIAMTGCSVSLAPTSMLSVSESCAQPKSMAASSTGLNGSNAAKGGTWIVALLATAAIAGGIYAAVDKKGTPTSP